MIADINDALKKVRYARLFYKCELQSISQLDRLAAICNVQIRQKIKAYQDELRQCADDVIQEQDYILELVNALPDDLERKIILMHYFEGQTFDEISEKLFFTKQWLFLKKKRALTTLQRMLNQGCNK